MGFGSFISHITKPVTRALGPVGTAVLLPVIPISQIAGSLIDKVAAGAMTPAHVSNVPVEQRGYGAGQNPSQSYSFYTQQPSQGYYGGPSAFQQPLTYPQAQSYYGGDPWASSTQSFQPSTMQYRGSSVPQDRTWEDLAMAALPFFL